VLCRLALLGILAADVSAHAQFAITEFLASNATGLRDEDGSASDWIELHNVSRNAASLEGWFLTDARTTLTRWRLPATNISADARLVVFASGKNRVLSGAPLHTNFRLEARGGFLALVKPDGITIASSFLYPSQFPDIAYGTGLGPVRDAELLFGAGATTKYLIPTAAVADAWRGGTAFDDSAWACGALPAGYDFGTGAVMAAYSAPGHTAGNQAFGGSLGMDFNVVQPVQVTALGCFDDLANGIAPGATVIVELWQRDDKQTPDNPNDDTGMVRLASRTFTSSSAGALMNGNRFQPLAAPVVLTNGAYTIVAYGYNGNERNGNNGGDFPALTLNSGGGALQFTHSRWGNAGTFPSEVDAKIAQYGAGTFQFQALPTGSFTTSLAAMRNTSASVLVRASFVVASNAAFATLVLTVTYDDGYVAWLNGTEVARRNAPATLAFNSTATNSASATDALDLTAFLGALHHGTNWLALHGLNMNASDGDFRLDASLVAERVATNAEYFLTPTPGGTNAPGLLFPRVVINEIHCDPPNSKSVPAEFVELYNPLPGAVDMSGWSFTKGVQFTFPVGTSIPSRGYLVVAENPAAVQQQFGVAALGAWTGSLANDGETLELVDSRGAMVDSLSYEVGFPWPVVGDEPGASMQLVNEGLDHNLGGSWRSALPTPGARNSVTASRAGPQVRQVNHFPRQPASGQVLTVTAKVTDPDEVQDVTLEYQIVEPGNYIRLTDAAFTNNWVSVPMRDDGLAGDALAGDSVYTALIAGNVQVHRRLIRYRINARGTAGNSVRVPYADDASMNFACFVYDGVPGWTGAVHPGVTPAVTFGTTTMRKVRALHLISRNAEVLDCQYNGAYNDTVFRFEGAIVLDGVVYDHIRYRIAGRNSTYVAGKNKWKFRFNRGHWLAFADEYGQFLQKRRETIKLSALAEPWAPWNRGLAGLDEALAFRVYNLAGVPAPRSAYLQLRVVDDAVEANSASQYEGDLWGLYLGFEEYDEQFKEEHALADGNLFLLQGGNNRLGAQGAGQPDDLSDLVGFTAAYNTSPTQPLAWWRTNVNLAGYYSWRAVTEAINNTDIREQENVAYFRNPTNGLWSVYPWDSDLLYEQFDRWGPQGVQSQAAYEQIRRCLEVPALKVEFQNRARELQDLLLNSDQAGKLVDELAGFFTDGGPTQPGFAEVDRRMWDWNPHTTAVSTDQPKGQFYRTPFPAPNFGFGPVGYSRALASADLAGQVAWVKNFIASDPHGGARLATLARDSTIPDTPALSYIGPAGFPGDLLKFQTSAFSSPANRTFSAVHWRLAEVAYPGVTNYSLGTPWRYEIEDLWTSGQLATLSDQVAIPVLVTRQGHTYRARVRMKDSSGRWSHWSASVEFMAGATTVTRLAEDLIVSELMYDPPDFGGVESSAFEFLELKNVGTSTLDLSGLNFTAGIDFTFPGGTLLPPGAFFLLARDTAGMALKYPGVVVNGIYTGRLDNAGETLTLTDANGVTVFSFAYGNAAPWPDTPHGQGYSLVPVSQTVAIDMSNPMNWRASFSPGGTPGTMELVNPVSAILELNLHHAVVVHGQPGLHYRVDYQDAGESPDVWHVLTEIPSLATASYVVYDPSIAGPRDRVYRVMVMP
jgi:hypothetical protein